MHLIAEPKNDRSKCELKMENHFTGTNNSKQNVRKRTVMKIRQRWKPNEMREKEREKKREFPFKMYLIGLSLKFDDGK